MLTTLNRLALISINEYQRRLTTIDPLAHNPGVNPHTNWRIVIALLTGCARLLQVAPSCLCCLRFSLRNDSSCASLRSCFVIPVAKLISDC